MTERTRTYTWEDPMLTADAAKTSSGLEFLQRMIRGEVPGPPIARLVDFTLVEVTEGRAVFEVMPQEFHYNPIGVVHGGLAGILLDSTMGCAVQTMLPAGVAYTTLDFHVNLVRGITLATGKLQAIGEVIHMGRTTATAEGRFVDMNGKLYAHGVTTCLILR